MCINVIYDNLITCPCLVCFFFSLLWKSPVDQQALRKALQEDEAETFVYELVSAPAHILV